MSCLCSRGLPQEAQDEDEALKKMLPRPRARQILASGALRLLSAMWLIAIGDAYVIQRMQDLPEEAFVPPKRAAELFDVIGGVVVISYRWVSDNHPDPKGFHVCAVRKYLKKHKGGHPFWEHLNDFGVFWDFASLPQDSADGTKKTEQAKRRFEKGLGAINLLYGDAKTLVIQLTQLPQELRLPDGSAVNQSTVNHRGYNARGWCFFEATVSSMLKDSFMLLDLGTGVATLNDAGAGWGAVRDASTANRRPPLTPEDMAIELQKRTFTNGGDAELVNKKYCEFFAEAAGSTETLDFENASAGEGWGDPEIAQLVRALPSFKRCRMLFLGGHRSLSERSLAELRAALPRCSALRRLDLPSHLKDTEEGQALSSVAAEQWVEVAWG